MPFAFRGEFRGLKETFRKLSALKTSVSKRILKKALGDASKKVLKDAKAKVPMASRLLKKSLGRKVKVYRRSGVVVALVGPRSGFKGMVIRANRAVLANPTKYAHLVELGTVRSQKRPFLEPAWTGKQAELVDGIKTVILAEIAKV